MLWVRKTRSTTSKRKTTRSTSRSTPTRRTTRRRKSNPILTFDIIGVILLFAAVVMLVALCAKEKTGVMGRYVAATMDVTVGVGAYLIPVMLGLLGVYFIIGPLQMFPRNIATGTGMLFLVVVSWASLGTIGKVDKVDKVGAGGYLGDGLARGLDGIAGRGLSYLILVAVGCVAGLIMTSMSVSNIIEKIHCAWIEWQEASEERLAERESRLGKDKSNGKAKQTKADEKKSKEEPEPEESRKRTLARIFSRDTAVPTVEVEPEVEISPVVEPVKPPVKISSGKIEKPPKNGGSEELEFNLEPVEQGEYQLPPTTLLNPPTPPPPRVESELRENIEIIERTIQEFKMEANVVEVAHGPTVARYEIRLAPGIKVNKIVGLAENLAMQLSAIDVRIEAPIPGKAAIGVEVPNRTRGTVGLREVLENKVFRESDSKLIFALGNDVAGNCKVTDLSKMPHLLVGGATNSGKSVCLNALIMSFLFRANPDELKMILIDPKRVELSLFDGIPHLACPVVKDVKQAAGVLRAATQEMEKRYDLLGRVGSRDIKGYNEKVPPEDKMPYMIIVVDELADLMMQCGAEVEGSITRLAQLARAVGIHLVIATQRPSVDVITGIIKANIPSRIAFAVMSHHDSRTILDLKGAERLIGFGDMLFLPIDANKPMRIQGCYVSEKEVEVVCKFLKDQRKPVYTITPTATGVGGGGGGDNEGDDGLADEFYEPSVRFVVNTGYCSTSMLQRKFKIGYTRAARIVDTMEQQGIVGPLDGAKPRQVLIDRQQMEQIIGGKLPFGPNGSDDEPEDDGYYEEAPPSEIIDPQDEDDEEEDEDVL